MIVYLASQAIKLFLAVDWRIWAVATAALIVGEVTGLYPVAQVLTDAFEVAAATVVTLVDMALTWLADAIADRIAGGLL